MSNLTKYCPKCKTDKPSKCFSIDRANNGGLRGHCKSCCNKQYKIYRSENSETVKAGNKKWKKANPDKVRSISRRGYRNNRKKHRDLSTAWAKKNREKIRESEKRCYQNNLTKSRARNLVGSMVQRGLIPRVHTFKCSKCPKQASQYHHHNGYEGKHKLDVVPLCAACHLESHGMSLVN